MIVGVLTTCHTQ